MTHSSHNRFDVFDFREEDEMVGKFDIKLQSRLQNPKFDGSPSLKYDFLACVAQGSDVNIRKTGDVQCVDVDSIEEAVHCSSNVATQTVSVSVEDGAPRPLIGCNGAIVSAFEPSCQISENIHVHRDMDNKVLCPGGHILEDDCVGSPYTESPTNSGSIKSTKSTPVLSSKDRSSSSPDGCADVYADPHTLTGLDLEEVDCVAIHADYVAFRGKYYPASQMTFSGHSIKIECSSMDKGAETFMYEWAIDDDVVTIQSQGYTMTSAVQVQIHVLSKSAVKTETLHNASGIEELKVMLFDPEWSLSLEKIMSLNVRYKAAWKVLASLEMVGDGVDLPVFEGQLSRRPYFPDFDEQFDEVIYPEGDVDAVSISKRDVDLLNPETFVNDTIIDFYIKYLKNEIPAGERNRFHFFNSFFFRKLADLDKNPDSAFDGKAAFQRVRKWTRKVNFFEKDYIFIPVNYNLHWSLIVICHPGQAADFIDEKMNESSKVPCILHMDSIRGSHIGLKKLIQSYLLEEWKERQQMTSEDISSKFLNLRFLSLELPQQENYYDCGLFLLHYVELFVKDAPVSFNPFNIAKYSNFLTADWFIPADVSLKRPYIQRLIREILLSRSQANCRNDTISDEDIADQTKLVEDNGNDNGTELISVSCNLQNTCTPDSSYSRPIRGIDMNLQDCSPVTSSDFPSQPTLAFRDLFEPGTSSGLLFDRRYDLGSYEHSRRNMSPIQEEVEEDDADHMYSLQNESNLFNRTVSWDRSFDLEDHDKEVEDSPLESEYDSDDDEVKVIETNSERKDDALSPQNEKWDPPMRAVVENLDSLTDSFVSASSEMMVTAAEDSQQYLDGNKRDEDSLFPVGENEHSVSSLEHEDQMVADDDDEEQGEEEAEEEEDAEEENEEEEEAGVIIKNSSSDSDELQPAKRLRLTPLGGETEPET